MFFGSEGLIKYESLPLRFYIAFKWNCRKYFEMMCCLLQDTQE